LRSSVILAGGRSTRIGVDKGLILLGGKPIVAHIAERLASVVDEVIVVVCADSQAATYRSLGWRVITDIYTSDTPLVGAYTGLAEARGEYTFLTAGDQPLLDPRIVELLFAEAKGHEAATPTWANGWVEPLHSVYSTKPAAEAAHLLVEAREKRLRMLLDALHDVKHVPIDELKTIDPELRTLMDVDTAEDLERVRHLIEKP
jgi:molybdopterin-guanine dinucleotide biosynthesis protein A